MRSGLLFSIIVLAVFCAPVLAYDWSTNPGDGSEANPYQISTPEQLMSIGSDEVLLTKHYILTNNIVFDPDNNPAHIFNDALIAPIDPSDTFEGQIPSRKQFSGTFDGNGYEIKNLVIENITEEYLCVGFFGSVRDMGKIINLHLVDARVEALYWTAPDRALGGLVALNWGRISHCSFTGVARTWYGDGITGGLVGVNLGEISRCFFGVLTYPHPCDAIGGLAGLNAETIQNSFPDGSFVGGGYTVGGLVGWNYNGIISGCYSIGAVDGDMFVGGLVSFNDNGTIENCYSTCSVKGDAGVGGLVGSNNNGEILNCYSVGLVDRGEYGPCGGLVGRNRDGVVDFSFWDMDTSGLSFSDGGTGLSTWDMYEKKTFLDAGWDFDNIWWIDEWRNYPILKWQLPSTPPVADAGEDQMVFAFEGGFIEVQLDGTNSYDKYDDALEYFWFNDANELIATGAEPNVVLGVGEHVIDLIVNDGVEDSEMDSCVVTVIEAIETAAVLTPQVLNRGSGRPHVIGRLEFAGEVMPVLDPNEPMVLLAGQGQIEDQRRMLTYSKKEGAWYLAGFFDNAALMEAIDAERHRQASLEGATRDDVEVTVAAKLVTGQWVYGMDVVKVK